VVLASGSEPPAVGPDPVAVLLGRLGLCYAVSPDGRSLAFGHSGGTVGLYELASGQLRRLLPGGGPCRAAAFTPDGSRLLTAGPDHSVLVWAVRVQDVAMPVELKRETSATRLWDRLTRGDAASAYLAMARLAAGAPAAPEPQPAPQPTRPANLASPEAPRRVGRDHVSVAARARRGRSAPSPASRGRRSPRSRPAPASRAPSSRPPPPCCASSPRSASRSPRRSPPCACGTGRRRSSAGGSPPTCGPSTAAC